jgi:hypothetical protein
MAIGDNFQSLADILMRSGAPVSPVEQQRHGIAQQELNQRQQGLLVDQQRNTLLQQQQSNLLAQKQQEDDRQKQSDRSEMVFKTLGLFDKSTNPAQTAAIYHGLRGAGYDATWLDTLKSGTDNRHRLEGFREVQKAQQQAAKSGATGGLSSMMTTAPPPDAASAMPSFQGMAQTGPGPQSETQWQAPPSFKSVGTQGSYFEQADPNAQPVFHPGAAGTRLTGQLGEMAQAYSILKDTNADPSERAAAEQYITSKEGGEYAALAQTLGQFKSPEERIEWLQQNKPGKLDYIKGIIDGRTQVTGFSQYANTIRDVVSMVDPKVDFQKVAARQRQWSTFGDLNGRFQQNRGSLNMIARHLGELDSSLDALKASNQPIENWYDMTAKQLTGDSTVTAFTATQLAVVLEAHRALSGVGITDQERQGWGSSLRSKFFGHDQAKQFIKTVGDLVSQRIAAQSELPPKFIRESPEFEYMQEDAKAALDKVMSWQSPNDMKARIAAIRAKTPPAVPGQPAAPMMPPGASTNAPAGRTVDFSTWQ